MNSIERADFAVIGTWRDEMKVDQDEVKAYVERKGRKYVIDNVVTRCPTNACPSTTTTPWKSTTELCALHALPERDAQCLSPGDDKGVTVSSSAASAP